MPIRKYKNKLLNISDITIKKIKAGDLADDLPEIYELKDVIENTIGHINKSVFDHTIDVLENLEKLINKNNKKQQLLILATLFHDIGKKETLMTKEGKTFCPRHELAGAEKTANILKRFNLSPVEKDYIIRIITNHGRLHDFMDKANRKNLEVEYNEEIKEIKDIIYEILLLTKSDTMGSDLKKDSPNEYNF